MISMRGFSKAAKPMVEAVASRARATSKRRYASTLSSTPALQNHRRMDPKSLATASQSLITKRWHGGPHIDHDTAERIHVTFVDADKSPLKSNVDAYVGESLLQVAQRNDIELEGACEGVCACSTCHVILEEDLFDSLEEASEDEEDMLDMAYGLTETSRLGCQITISKEMDGMEVEIPPATRNFYVDGHVPKPH